MVLLNTLWYAGMSMKMLKQLGRYVAIGGLLNIGWFLLYLVLTSLGLQPLAVVTGFFPAALLLSYYSHKRHTFEIGGRPLRGYTLGRFLVLNLAGFALNYSLLYGLYQRAAVPHQIVQLIAMCVCALFLFAGMKMYVFNSKP